MPKRNNMGRGSHHAMDAELHQTEPAKNAPKSRQQTRPTQHPAQGKEDAKEVP